MRPSLGSWMGAVLVTAWLAAPAYGQHEGHAQPPPEESPPSGDHAGHAAPTEPTAPEGPAPREPAEVGQPPVMHEHGGQAQTGTDTEAEAPHAMHAGGEPRDPVGVSLTQNASGTAWQPASTPMLGHMRKAGGWSLMFHYLVFGGVDVQRSARGATEGVSTNWLMGMAQRPLLGGELTARGMLSAEPLFLGPDGYALLLQTGETSGGEPLVDRQHPHDLFMELALKYNRPLFGGVGLELYAAPAGEPALGPPGFPHRASALGDPLAPLSHHWQDSTHIVFGVLTAGLYTRHAKLEGSWFNGREPDEHRYDFDLRVPDSYSVRLSVNPTDDWSGQLSYGSLNEPEYTLEPGVDVRRWSASATHNRALAGDGNWATTFAWGQNRPDHGEPSNALLLETNLMLGKNDLFARGEYVVKSGHDFGLEGALEEATLPVGAIAAGYVRDFGPWSGVTPGLGVRAALNFIPDSLQARYGTSWPVGFMVYARLRPAEMRH